MVKNASDSGSHTLPLLCWILLLTLLLSIIVSIVVICCVCLRARKSYTRNNSAKEEPLSHHQIASHINGFSPTIHSVSTHQTLEMLPKYVASPAQSYSTQKLYQWCQQKELQQHYKSLWTVNTNSNTGKYFFISLKN